MAIMIALFMIAEGVALGMFFLAGKFMNSAIMIAIPLLALAIGVDDMFVILRYYSELGHDFITTNSEDEVMGEVFARAGPGTTLTSVVNCVVFACGSQLPIPAMADFCICAVFVAAWNYAVMMNMFMPLITMEIHRVANEGPDPHPFTFFYHRHIINKNKAASPENQRRSITATSSENFTRSYEKRLKEFMHDTYAPFLCKPVVSVFVTLLAIGFLVWSVTMINAAEVGWGPQDLFHRDSPSKRAMEWLFTRFSLFPGNLVFHDINVPENQVNILNLYDSVANAQYSMHTSNTK
jgi:hypothetical protein